MNVVLSVEPKGDKAALLVMDSGERVWTPDRTKAQDLVGRPIPETWTQKQGEYGPQAFPPREGKPGGKPAWANTEEGEKYVQERMDRRTALMQALIGGWKDVGGITLIADQLYEWLRKNLDVSASAAVRSDARPGDSSHRPVGAGSAHQEADTPLDGGGESSYGEAPPSSSINADTCPLCGKEWGPMHTGSGMRVCVQGHVERWDG